MSRKSLSEALAAHDEALLNRWRAEQSFGCNSPVTDRAKLDLENARVDVVSAVESTAASAASQSHLPD